MYLEKAWRGGVWMFSFHFKQVHGCCLKLDEVIGVLYGDVKGNEKGPVLV